MELLFLFLFFRYFAATEVIRPIRQIGKSRPAARF